MEDHVARSELSRMLGAENKETPFKRGRLREALAMVRRILSEQSGFRTEYQELEDAFTAIDAVLLSNAHNKRNADTLTEGGETK